MEQNLLFKDEVFKIIGCCYEVFNHLGNGFLEAIYQEALAYEFSLQNIPCDREKKLYVKYKDIILNKEYIADFICFESIILELKALKEILPVHESQVINYLKTSGYKLGLIVNFGEEKVTYKRIIL